MKKQRLTTPKTFKRARELRRDMTPQERKLHARLRAHRTGDVHFRPQHAIGRYIADFFSPKNKLIIELDGSQHLEQDEYDRERTAYFESRGYRVIRFWNNDVTNDLDGVIRAILFALGDKKP